MQDDKIKDKNDINQSKVKIIYLDDLMTLWRSCNWMISMANINTKRTLEASKYKHFKEEILEKFKIY